jgi:hypothetical protein
MGHAAPRESEGRNGSGFAAAGRGVVHAGGEVGPMKIALLAVLGLFLRALGGAALGIGAGLAWVEIFKTTDFEG